MGIKHQNFRNALQILKEATDQKETISTELFNQSGFFSKTEQLQSLYTKTLDKLSDLLDEMDKRISKTEGRQRQLIKEMGNGKDQSNK